ncbi:MAG: hypothetical protein R6X02_07725, partial [Enhygromyxa sp.]
MIGAVVLALILAGPPKGEDSQESAWEAAGWGAPEDEESPTESPEESPETPELEPERNEPQESAWEAAGWGAPEPNEPKEARLESASEGPAPAEAPEQELGASAWDQPSTDAEPDKARRKVGDVLMGSLRLTGSYLHFDDEPALFPEGDDALLVTVGRILVEADAGKHVHFSFNGFGELARSPLAGGLQGSFASAGSTRSAYRTRYLSWSYWESGAILGQLGVDRASMRLSFDSVNLDIGRFPITYSVTGMFTTNDFFAPFSATAVNRIYKPG